MIVHINIRHMSPFYIGCAMVSPARTDGGGSHAEGSLLGGALGRLVRRREEHSSPGAECQPDRSTCLPRARARWKSTYRSLERGAGRAHQAQVGTGQAWKAPGYVPPWGPSLVVNQHRSTNFRKKIQMTTLLALVAAAVLALQAGHGVGGCGRPYYPRIQTTSCCPPMIVIEQSTSKAH